MSAGAEKPTMAAPGRRRGARPGAPRASRCEASNSSRWAATSARSRAVTGDPLATNRLQVMTVVCTTSQVLVIGTGAAFRRRPGDDLVGILDVAGLAVHAIRGINLQTAAPGLVGHHFVHARGAEVLAGIAVLLRAAGGADRGIGDFQVDRLRFIVRVSREEDERYPVARRQRARAPLPVRRLELVELFEPGEIRGVLQRPWRVAESQRFPTRN